jgi:hypothetical protein
MSRKFTCGGFRCDPTRRRASTVLLEFVFRCESGRVNHHAANATPTTKVAAKTSDQRRARLALASRPSSAAPGGIFELGTGFRLAQRLSFVMILECGWRSFSLQIAWHRSSGHARARHLTRFPIIHFRWRGNHHNCAAYERQSASRLRQRRGSTHRILRALPYRPVHPVAAGEVWISLPLPMARADRTTATQRPDTASARQSACSRCVPPVWQITRAAAAR